jgi:long-chain acyl-CoA synthetase
VVAYVTLREGHAPDEQALIGFCREHLAAYKYPRRIAFVEALPKSASGKVLRRLLRDEEATRMTRSAQ